MLPLISFNRKLNRKGRIWQEEYFDHSIRSDEYLNTKMAYVLQNPVRKHIVETARGYKWVWTADPEFMSNFLVEDPDPGRGGRGY